MPKKKLYDRVSKDAFERLELSAGKLARSVLRGLGAGNRVRLPYIVRRAQFAVTNQDHWPLREGSAV
jgi:hypothetical protein